jgi:DNA-binding transcriptional MerR regulator
MEKTSQTRPDLQQAENKLLLKVGELAKRTGLTVRALHHYDAIGLLQPSVRSQAGYRLYDKDDIARLHAIQALRNLGFPLNEIDGMLSASGASLPDIILRQMNTLDQEIAKAMELRRSLSMLHDSLAAGTPPNTDEWLAALRSMATRGKYFTADEIRFITENWKRIEAEWQPLLEEVRAALQASVPVDSPLAQGLARKWMDLSMRWMHNDLDLLVRWKDMLQKEPEMPGVSDSDYALYQYIGSAIELRHAIIQKYLTTDEMKRLHKGLENKWAMLEAAVNEAIRQQLPADSETVLQLVGQWNDLMDELTDHDPVIRKKFMTALNNEPFLQLGSPLSAEVRGFIRHAAAAIVTAQNNPAKSA